MPNRLRSASSLGAGRRRRFSPLMLIGIAVPLVLILIGATIFFLLPYMGTHAANNTVNMDCNLIVPAHPLTATGLATPYQLVATDPNKGPCNEANKLQAAFVQAAVIDPATGQISVYDPLVIDKGSKPAVNPVVPTLPQGGIVGIWFGFNGNNLTLQSSHNSLNNGHCVNGNGDTIFGQFAYCNAPTFFAAANDAIAAGKLTPPPLGVAKDGQTCPTVRDFSVVDQDQSDNVTTTYLVSSTGQMAQMTAANAKLLQNQQPQVNGSDNRLLAIALDGALGCNPWMAPDLADPGQTVTALPLNELQAAALQANPIALVPAHDPMVLSNNKTNQDKLNAYRVGVDQPQVNDVNMATSRAYCTNLFNVAPGRLALDAPLTRVRPSPDPAVANSLFTFLAQRFATTYGPNGLNCVGILGIPDPVAVQTNANGVAIDAMINASTAPSCVVNGTTVPGCTGTTTINGQTCAFTFDPNTHQVNITCPAPAKK